MSEPIIVPTPQEMEIHLEVLDAMTREIVEWLQLIMISRAVTGKVDKKMEYGISDKMQEQLLKRFTDKGWKMTVASYDHEFMVVVELPERGKGK